MSLLDSMSLVSSAPIAPMMVTITGDAGTAKTSLLSLFPKTLIIRTEDGTKSLNNKDQVMQTPVINNSATVLQWLSDIYNDTNTKIRTVGFDSITKLNSIIEDEICANDRKNPKSINTACGGFGAGHNAVAKVHRSIKDWCDILRDHKGINIVFIAHSKIDTLDSPDMDAYSRYGIKMAKQSWGVYVDDVDMVCQARHKIAVLSGKGELDKSKAVSTGGIELMCHANASNITKNRYEIKTVVPFLEGVFPFQSIIDTGRYDPNYKVEKTAVENLNVDKMNVDKMNVENLNVDKTTGEIKGG